MPEGLTTSTVEPIFTAVALIFSRRRGLSVSSVAMYLYTKYRCRINIGKGGGQNLSCVRYGI